MTALAIPANSRGYQASLGHELTFAGTLNSEWIKLRSVRSTWFAAIGLVALTFVFGVPIASAMMDQREGVAGPAGVDDFSLLLANNGLTILGQMIALVLGALAVTSEYGSGSIRSTLSAVPRRGQLFAAKIIVVVAFAAVTAAIALGLTVGAIEVQLRLADAPSGIGPHAWSLAFAGVYYVSVSALIGVGLGFILRSSAGAIATGIGLLFVVPMILAFGVGNDVIRFLLDITPMQAANLMANSVIVPGGDSSVLGGYWGAVACLAAWVVAVLGAGYAVFKRRDA